MSWIKGEPTKPGYYWIACRQRRQWQDDFKKLYVRIAYHGDDHSHWEGVGTEVPLVEYIEYHMPVNEPAPPQADAVPPPDAVWCSCGEWYYPWFSKKMECTMCGARLPDYVPRLAATQ